MSDEKKFPTTTSEWNDNIELILKDIGESCIGYKYMNIFAARKNQWRFNLLIYTSIFIGPIAGVLSAISTVKEDTSELFPVLITVFSFLSGVISTTIKFSEFNQKAIAYKSTAAKYASLETNIRRQLSLTRPDRVNAGDYLQWISSSYDELFTSAPLISDQIHIEWLKYAKDNNISIPKEQSHSIKIATTIPDKINTDNTVIDIFSDGKMRYEMGRFYRGK